MQEYVILETKSSPRIEFDPESGVLDIRGESYPENCTRLYGPMFKWLDEFFADPEAGRMELNMEIVYFNSSTSKTFMDLFDLLEEEARGGRCVVVNWHYHEENEIAQECGEEFMEDVEFVRFNLVEFSDQEGS